MIWTTNEYGTRCFSFEHWEVNIWPANIGGRISVRAPSPGGESHEVEVHESGIWVFGEASGSWASCPTSVTIPWEVIEAIMEARRIVATESAKQSNQAVI